MEENSGRTKGKGGGRSLISPEGKYLLIATGVVTEFVALPLIWRNELGVALSIGLTFFILLSLSAIFIALPGWLGSLESATNKLTFLVIPLSIFPIWAAARLIINVIYPQFYTNPALLVNLLVGWSIGTGILIGFLYSAIALAVISSRERHHR